MTGTVLIVDDSLTVRMDLAEAFEAAGFEPVLCANVADARTALAERMIGVVVLDVMLPDGDGVELLREIRSVTRGADAAILMLSSEAEVRDRVRALQTGADEYVGKPYDRRYVVAKARELLRGKSGGASPRATTVLVIDDSLTFRQRLGEALEHAGYRVALAATGEDGLRVAADLRPAAIVVDGVLPGIDGATVVRTIRLDQALRGTPCLLLTASDERDAELRALDAGADAFVRKDEDLEVVLARVAASLRASAASADRTTASLLGPRKILAVDDSVTYLHELAANLRGEGYDVSLARSGEEALELLAIESVDCVLLDLVMPGLGGHETCRRIKAAPSVRDVPLIMLTALEDREAMLEGLGAGADDFIPKSSEFSVLRARVRAQIRRKQFEDENRRIREQLLRTEIEAAEARAARQLAVALERQNQELEAFSYSVSHDLRAPLRTIDGFTKAIEEDFGEQLEQRGKDYLVRVRGAAHRMAELIEDLLRLSRVNRAELRMQEIDIAAIARTTLAELQQRDPGRKVTIRITEPLTAHGDVGLVRAALENILGNAWKFTRYRAHAVIDVGSVDCEGGPAFCVRDNGVGFTDEEAAGLFRPFHRLHSSDEFEGTGIGLATVARIIERHGGRVWAAGEAGQGASIYFTL
jgi:two-component system, NtrC family, sensor kinase